MSIRLGTLSTHKRRSEDPAKCVYRQLIVTSQFWFGRRAVVTPILVPNNNALIKLEDEMLGVGSEGEGEVAWITIFLLPVGRSKE